MEERRSEREGCDGDSIGWMSPHAAETEEQRAFRGLDANERSATTADLSVPGARYTVFKYTVCIIDPGFRLVHPSV